MKQAIPVQNFNRDLANLGENLGEISRRSRRDSRRVFGRRDLEISGQSRRESRRDSRQDLGEIPGELLAAEISEKSWRDLGYLAEISSISPRSRQSRRDLGNLGEISSISPRSRQSRRDLGKNFVRVDVWRSVTAKILKSQNTQYETRINIVKRSQIKRRSFT